MSGFSRWGAGWRGVRMLRTWSSPGKDLVREEIVALEVRNLQAALRRAADDRSGLKLKDRLEGAVQASLRNSVTSAVPLMLELSNAEMEQFQRHGAMAVPAGIVWPA